MTEIKWEEPPAHSRNHGAYNGIAQTLRDNPGRWALIGDDCSANLVGQIKSGTNRSFRPAGHFEARGTMVSSAEGRRQKVWARYVGEVTA